VWQLPYGCGGSWRLAGVLLVVAWVLGGAGALTDVPAQPPIAESDIAPHSRPLTHAQLLEEYLAELQEHLKLETRDIDESALVEVKMTVRKDGTVTFAEIIVLDGPAALRNDLLPILNRLSPLAPPPIAADLLAVSLLLPLRYPGPDLLDSIGQAP
jgi:hypothetical protein